MKQFIRSFWGLVLMLVVASAISGCKKFLDRKPLGTATEGDLSVGGVEGKVFGLYGALRNNGMTDFPMLWFKTIRSDDAVKGSTTGDLADAGQIMDNFQYTKDHWLLNAYWDDHFGFINATNDVLHDIDSLKLTDAGSIINAAEARFMRAYAYFDLVRDYGEVPIINFKVYNVNDANKPKSTVAQVYAFIDADLAFAAQNLPLAWSAQYEGRVTKGAANTLIAKTQLYRQNWSGALAKAEEVISSGQYGLYPSYQNFFKEEGENSQESIFEVQMYVSPNGTQTIGNSHFQVQGVRGSGDWDLGWGFNVPSVSLDTSYEVGDPRRTATILYSGQPDGIYGRTVPTAPPLVQPMWNKKAYPDPARRNSISDKSQDGHFSKWMNIRLLRYADVLLMAAEAANELGGAANTTKALGYLEAVRARARGGNNTILPPVTTTNQALLRVAIQKERRAEFGMEFERFYDLVRWGLAATYLPGYQNKNRFYPIPQPAIDRSGGVLVQNPEW
ncbi:MAG TPA: RagB/SusD family nutrient uptake outer membrane protein [Chitinophagaceae bacterium]